MVFCWFTNPFGDFNNNPLSLPWAIVLAYTFISFLPMLRNFPFCRGVLYYAQNEGELPHWSEWRRLVKSSPGRNNLDRHLFGEPNLCSARWYPKGGLVQLDSNDCQQMGGSRQSSAALQSSSHYAESSLSFPARYRGTQRIIKWTAVSWNVD